MFTETNSDEKALEWNVLTSPWVDIMTREAEPRATSPLDALEHATRIACLALDNPLDDFAVHRFLLTLLYWKAHVAGGVERLRERLLQGEMPRELVSALREEASTFRLFDAKEPFLQDPSLAGAKKADWKPAGSLFAEVPSGTNIAHFHHVEDKSAHLCLRCATLGMLRVVPWTQSGGAGLTPSIHNAPPVMALAKGQDLCVALGRNLVPLDAPAGEPHWTGKFTPSGRKPVPYMEAFTWSPRRINLRQPDASAACDRCGRTGVPAIGQIVYAKNEDTKSEKKGSKTVPFAWRDPSAFYESEDSHTAFKSTREDRAAFGSDIGRLAQDGPQRRDASKWSAQVIAANPDHRGWRLIVPTTNPANNKSYDHRVLDLADVSTESLNATSPAPVAMPTGVDGWLPPEPRRAASIARHFVEQATQVLADGDWAVLQAAAYRRMDESPAGFDVLTSLLWGLRNRDLPRPSPAAGWLVLKLMASVPARARSHSKNAEYSPLRALPTRQPPRRKSSGGAYPASLPHGNALERELRTALEANMRRAVPMPVGWAGLCSSLHQILSKQPSWKGD